MPYIAQKQKEMLEEVLTCLANELCAIYPTTGFRLLAYKYVCLKLGMDVLPQRRYATLSALRAVYSDASCEWQRRLKVKPKKFINTNVNYTVLNGQINGLSRKIISIASQSREPHLAWQGLLNYSVTVLGLEIVCKQKHKRFNSITALIAGVLEFLHNYFYEVEMAVYEDEQIIKNGDVF